jgi:hypothetical protein
MALQQRRADCLNAHCPKASISVNGKAYKAASIADTYERHVALLRETAATRAKWLKLVEDERKLSAELQPTTKVVASYIANTFGVGSEAYIDFGLADQTVTSQKLETKVTALQKREATRKARHVMGRAQRLAIHAEAEAAVEPPQPPQAGEGTTTVAKAPVAPPQPVAAPAPVVTPSPIITTVSAPTNGVTNGASSNGLLNGAATGVTNGSG